jgi:hypothetical protein
MLFVDDVRNVIVSMLAEYLGVPGVLSDQVQPVPGEWPFFYYSVLTSYVPLGDRGNQSQALNGDGITVERKRVENPYATLSFTFCSINRWECDETGKATETYIYGEDEANRLAEKAQGWFLHVAYNDLSNLGIVINQVTNTTNRTSLVVDEAARRYGFDVRVRYTRIDTRTDSTVESVLAIRKSKE